MSEPVNNIDPKAVKVLNEFAKNKLPNNLEWLDDIDFTIYAKVQKNPIGFEGTEINMRLKLEDKAKAAITAKINEIVDTIIGEDEPDWDGGWNEEMASSIAETRRIVYGRNKLRAELRKRKDEVLR